MTELRAPFAPGSVGSWLSGLLQPNPEGYVLARWVLLRGLAVVFFSAFYSFAYQIDGLIGPDGILPANAYLKLVHRYLGVPTCYFQVPTLFHWLGTSTNALNAIVTAGLACSVLLVFNLAPRLTLALCTAFFLSLINVSQVFASYQSDGMLLEAGLYGILLAPGGWRPGLGATSPPSRLARWLLVWEWFRIYFESGVAKLASGDPEWRHLKALDHYYENGPLPTVIGWYAQHLPHAVHVVTAGATLAMELGLVWLAFLPRRFRLMCAIAATAFQVGIILTANYAFLNYLVLLLGVLLVDDRSLRRWLSRWARSHRRFLRKRSRKLQLSLRPRTAKIDTLPWVWAKLGGFGVLWYATLLQFPGIDRADLPAILNWPVLVLEPFRFANGYGLFAVMTRKRFEIEFQGSLDGSTYEPYPFRYKPQDPSVAPGIYAPYQPRFEWNLWFASLGGIRQNPWVLRAAVRLLEAKPDVLRLFAFDPFHGGRPKSIRTVIYRYWFSSLETLRKRGVYWERQELGSYAPSLTWKRDGTIGVLPDLRR